MKNVIIRAISGSIYVAAMVGAVLAGGGWLAALLVLLGLLATLEFVTMTAENGKIHRVCSLIDLAATISIILTGYFVACPAGGPAHLFMMIAGICILARMVAQLYSLGNNAIHALGASMFNYIYIGLSLALVPALYYGGAPHLVLALLIFIWVNDTGAFCVGSLIGRHKLFERISPKKSVEGFFGGMAFVVIAAVILNLLFDQWYGFMSCGQMIWLGIVVSILATYGDLIESLIKRTAGVKDSGKIIPGHGGILDRIDSLLLVFPGVWLYMQL